MATILKEASKAPFSSALFRSLASGRTLKKGKLAKGIGFNLTGRKFFVRHKTKVGNVFSFVKNKQQATITAERLNKLNFKGVKIGRNPI